MIDEARTKNADDKTSEALSVHLCNSVRKQDFQFQMREKEDNRGVEREALKM